MQFLIEAVENVGRCQRSDHIKKAINYVKILLDKQADPNAHDEWGHGAALHYAIWSGQTEVVKLLLDTEGCNVEVDTGRCLLHLLMVALQLGSDMAPGLRQEQSSCPGVAVLLQFVQACMLFFVYCWHWAV